MALFTQYTQAYILKGSDVSDHIKIYTQAQRNGLAEIWLLNHKEVSFISLTLTLVVRLGPANTGTSDSSPPLVPVHHERFDLCGTVEPSVPLQRVNERCVRSSSGFLPMHRFPKDHLAGDEL